MNVAEVMALIPRAEFLTAVECVGREDWLVERGKGIGGSDLYRVLHEPYDLWREKTGRDEGFQGNGLTEMGQDTEESTLTRWAGDVGATLIRPVPFLRDTVKPWLCASLDALAIMPDGEVVVVDAKYTTQDWRGDIPERIYLQMAFYTAITGLRTAYIAKRDPRGKRESIPMSFAEGEADPFLAAMDSFWLENVVKDSPPDPMTEGEIEAAALERMKGRALVPKMDATALMLVVESELADCDRTMKAAKARADSIKSQIAEQMALHGVKSIQFPDGSVWRYKERAGSVQWKPYALSIGGTEEGSKAFKGSGTSYVEAKHANQDEDC